MHNQRYVLRPSGAYDGAGWQPRDSDGSEINCRALLFYYFYNQSSSYSPHSIVAHR